MMAVVPTNLHVGCAVPSGLGRKYNAPRHLRAGLSHSTPSGLEHARRRGRRDHFHMTPLRRWTKPAPTGLRSLQCFQGSQARAGGRASAAIATQNHVPQADRPRERESLPCFVDNCAPGALRRREPRPGGPIRLSAARRLGILFRGGQKIRRRVESDYP
jgi:hypothetical protein